MERYDRTTLDVTGFDGPVPHEFWSKRSDTLLVMLPGLGYNNYMPLMFYLQELGMTREWDLLIVHYDYRSVSRDAPAEEWQARFVGDVQPLIDEVLVRRSYDNVILAGKSIGTSVMTALLGAGFDRATGYIWLTPLLANEPVAKAVMAHGPAVSIFGDADHAVAGVDVEPFERAGVTQIIVPNANHSVELPGDVPGSIRVMGDVIQQLDGWLTETFPRYSQRADNPLELNNAKRP